MHMTRNPASADAPTRFHGWPAAFRATPLLGALVLTALPVAAQGQTLNTNVTRLANPVVVVQPTLRQINPTQTLNTTVLRPLAPSTVRIAPTLAPTLAPTANPTIRTTGIAPSVAATGLSRLVAPGAENASAVVARIGTTARAEISNLTVDFDGDGLINFELAPGIVELPTDTTGGADASHGGLVGQHISMAAGTADRVLDGVINVAGVNPATTFEIDNGTVVLGGFRPQDVAGVVDIPIPDGPTTHDPDGAGGRDPGRQTGPQGDDHATRGPDVNDPQRPIEICLSHGCYGGPSEPKPGTDPDLKPGPDPDLSGIFDFSGFRRPPTPEPNQNTGTDDLLNVSIMLPLRGREREADQFSNYGNEEIW